MNILIVGANFSNKGAQSMLFVTIDEIRKRFGKDSKIYYQTHEVMDLTDYKFDRVFSNQYSRAFLIGDLGEKVFALIKGVGSSTIKFFLKRGNRPFEVLDLKQIIKKIDLIIDVSGYNLGSKWPNHIIDNYLLNIEIAKKYDIPIFMMPQSFGPFEFKNQQDSMDTRIKECMSYPKIVFAREREGFNLLVNKYGLTNVKYSPDLVLENTGIDPSNIYKSSYAPNVPAIDTVDSVGVLPNMRSFDHAEKDKILSVYKFVLEELLNMGKKVYLFRHSFEDLEACKWIKAMFQNEERVLLIDSDFSSLEYEIFIKNFEFLIAARFHSIVHAYKNNIPCIAFGWAVKYQELLSLMKQEKYALDITIDSFTNQDISEILQDMSQNVKNNVETIRVQLRGVQANNCFDSVEKIVKVKNN
jgi:colanic acid/amylovoran biosynthesis protein